MEHGGNPVTEGVRYILAVFLYHDPTAMSVSMSMSMSMDEFLSAERKAEKRRPKLAAELQELKKSKTEFTFSFGL